VAVELLAGTALGSLVGLLVGLSTEKLTGAILAGLVALLAAFFGLKDSREGGPPGRLARIIGFAVAAALMLPASVILRSHDVLGADPAVRLRHWEALGISAEDARKLVIFETLGLNLTQGKVATETPARSGVLFAAALEDCPSLAAERFNSTADRLHGFSLIPPWDKLAGAVAAADTKTQAAVLDAAWRIACAAPPG
jgi:hypothetical protein